MFVRFVPFSGRDQVANTVKHLAFTRYGELNLHGMVDAQVEVLEGELLTGNTLM